MQRRIVLGLSLLSPSCTAPHRRTLHCELLHVSGITQGMDTCFDSVLVESKLFLNFVSI